MYVLDSSALIEIIQGYPRMGHILSLVGEESLVTTSVNMHELLVGAWTDKERFFLTNIFMGAHILEHTSHAAQHGARIEQELARSGKMVNKMDILIAGICKANNAELVTLDKDFAKIKGIKTHIIR